MWYIKNLLGEKGIQHHYLDVSKIPLELLTYLRMYSNTYPIVLGVKHFSPFNAEYLNDIWILKVCFFYTSYKTKTPRANSRTHELTNPTNELNLLTNPTNELALLTYITYSTYNI